jgi:apolipoprotein N-acyltransferase
MTTAVKLYAHAGTLAAWAIVVWVLQLKPSTGVIVLMLATIATAAWVAERERGRVRRDRRGA